MDDYFWADFGRLESNMRNILNRTVDPDLVQSGVFNMAYDVVFDWVDPLTASTSGAVNNQMTERWVNG